MARILRNYTVNLALIVDFNRGRIKNDIPLLTNLRCIINVIKRSLCEATPQLTKDVILRLTIIAFCSGRITKAIFEYDMV